MPTRMLWRRPASVRVPGGDGEQIGAASTCTSSRFTSSWFVPCMCASKISRAIGHEAGVRDPRAVVAVVHLAELVGAHLRERRLVRRRVVLDRDLRGHAAHRVHAAAVAGLDEELRRRRARNALSIVTCAAVGQDGGRVVRALLDEAEDVVPAPAVEARRVLAQLVEDLVHLERGGERLDEDRRLDGAAREAERVLRADEDVVPEARLEVALQLRQVEERPGAARDAAPSRCGRRRGRSRRARRATISPSTTTCFSGRCQPRGRTKSTAVFSLSAYFLPSGASNVIVRRTASQRFCWPVDEVVPGRRGRVLEVRHEDVRARVERVDDHLAVDRPGDLDAAIEEVGRAPGAQVQSPLADARRLGEEVELGGAVRVERAWRSRALREQLRRRAAGRSRTRSATNASASVERMSASLGPVRAFSTSTVSPVAGIAVGSDALQQSPCGRELSSVNITRHTAEKAASKLVNDKL